MTETLNSIYLRLNVDMQNLASKAIAQIIVKLVYANEGGMTKGEIMGKLAKVNDGKSIDDSEIDEILKELSHSELTCHKGRYNLSTARREKINKTVSESEQRRAEIISRFFSGLNSDKKVIEEWLVEMSLKFFENYSDEWISDLLAKTDRVTCRADSIREQVTRRTYSMSQIDKEDMEVLPQRFFDFINSHEDIVDAYMWEYGTSAFASKLIRNKHGVDNLTIETFKDSYCMLDTNVLIFIALGNKYKESFKAIEKVFSDINVKAEILYITKREYENKVKSQRYETIANLENFGYEIASMPDDDFTKMALQCGCRYKSDFESFFDYTLSLPESIFKKVAINLKDNDSGLNEVIEKVQADESLIEKLRNISKRFTRYGKRDSACRHDIGLIEGVRHLRDSDSQNNKYFILSDDYSINQYSKEYGLRKGLPLSIRVDTLINMLAINNGGDTFDAADYRPLFANIIRLGLIPRKDTFRQSELYQLSQMNERVTKLPTDEVRVIVNEVHRRYLEGNSEEDIRRDLNEMVTKGEISAKDEVQKAKDQLLFESKQKQDYQSQSAKDRRNLERTVISHVTKEYDNTTKNMTICWWVVLSVVCLGLALLIAYLYQNSASDNTRLEGLAIGFLGSAILEVIVGIAGQRKMINRRKSNRDRDIRNTANAKLAEIDGQDD